MSKALVYILGIIALPIIGSITILYADIPLVISAGLVLAYLVGFIQANILSRTKPEV
jgi:hypothetical protein